MPSGKKRTTNVAKVDRTVTALALRREGMSYEAIAQRLGISQPTAWRDVSDALKALQQEPAEDLRKIEVQRLDDLLLALWPKAKKGHPASVDRVIRIMERRARLLGLDAPTSITADVTGGLAELLARGFGAPGAGEVDE